MVKRKPTFQTKSAVAYDALLEAIKTGRLKAGEKVTLAGLSKQLDMSLTPVRDALALLAEQGLVTRKPHHATIIAKQTIIRASEVAMLRAMLEPEAARLAAGRADESQLESLELICDASDRAAKAGDIRKFRFLNKKFHLFIAELSGSELLEEFIGSLWDRMPVQSLTLSGKNKEILDDHRELFEALRSRDGDRAHAIMKEHVGHAKDTTGQYFETLQSEQEA